MSSQYDQTDNNDIFTMEEGSGIYEFTWPNLNISARVERLKDNSDNELRGEIWVESQRPNSAGHVKQGRVILTSPTSRNQFAKALSTRDAEVDWDQIVEQMAIAVIQDWREGIPAVEITGQVAPAEAARWLIYPLVQMGNPTLIYGKGSSGKSWLAQYLSVLVHEGMDTGGLTVDKAKVLYLDWETDQHEIITRISMIRKGLGLSTTNVAPGLVYKPMTQGLAADINTVKTIVKERDIHFVILDSLGSACMGEPESAEVVLRMFSALRSLGVSSLCVDHTNHEGRLFGSVYKFNSARQIFEAKKSQAEDESRLEFAMFHRKANNSKLIKPLGWVLNFDNQEHSTTLTRRDVRDTKLETEMRVVDRISNILREGKHTVSELADLLEKTQSHISKELAVHKNQFVKLPDGTYANRARSPEDVTDKWEL